MRKFYKAAEAGTAPGGYVIRLDGKPVRTPLQKPLILSSEKLAGAIAEEWQSQKEDIVPASMPLTKLANTMIDKARGDDRIAMMADIVRYAGSDLVCYFSDRPADLIERQNKHWLPLLSWIKDEFGIELSYVTGIQYQNQPDEAVKKFEDLIKDMDDVDFTIMQDVTAITGSAVIALAFLRGHLDAEAAYEASCVDEIYQLEKWGEDKPARDRLNKIKADLDTAGRFQALIRG